jgi:putative ABC transport system permease protein
VKLGTRISTLGQDIRYACRMLRKNPGFTTVVVVTLALGIGANTVTFSMLQAALAIAIPDSNRVVLVHTDNTKRGVRNLPASIPDFLDWRDSGVFSHIGAFTEDGVNVRLGDRVERVSALFVTAGFFEVVDPRLRLGRVFTEPETSPSAAPVVVLSEKAWQSRFLGDTGIIGRTVVVDGVPRNIIGVLPRRFPTVGREELYVPLVFNSAKTTERGSRSYPVIGRLRQGLTLPEAQRRMSDLADHLGRQYPDDEGNTFRLQPVREAFLEDARTLLGVLFGAVGFVLMIACANIAGLLLARSTARQREMSIRTALGASRWMLTRQLLTESSVLALLGGAVAVVPAVWGMHFISSLKLDELPNPDLISLNWTVLAFNLGVSLVTGLLFGCIPAFTVWKTSVSESLKATGASLGGGAHQRLRSLFVVSEIALTLVLIVGAGLALQSFLRLRSSDPGYDARGLLTMRVALSERQYQDGEKQGAFFERLIDRARVVPGLESISGVSELPASDSIHATGFLPTDRPEPRRADVPIVLYESVLNDYFRTMRVPIVAGRFFNERDRTDSQPVAIIDEWAASRYWPNQSPIGQHVRLGFRQPPREIVGVVGAVEQRLVVKVMLGQIGQAYLPMSQAPKPAMSLVVRPGGDSAEAVSAIRSILRGVDQDQALFEVQLMDEMRAEGRALHRLAMSLLGAFALLALLLAAIGLYGVIAFSVGQRTREFGIRMSLGAQRRDVLRLVVGQGVIMTVIGIGLGLAGAFSLTRVMGTMLYGIGANDSRTFGWSALLLAAVALLASYVPARRATLIDPVRALRND